MPARKPVRSTSPEYLDSLAAYERLVATNPAVERKGDTMPYTSVNGNMFSLLTRGGKLVLRLPTEERTAFREQYGTGPVVQYGAVMPEYVEVPDALLRDTPAMTPYFQKSYAYGASLRPKPTTKRKS
jgi:TfoX/Sxy family transcriptional regulator of competence genes